MSGMKWLCRHASTCDHAVGCIHGTPHHQDQHCMSCLICHDHPDKPVAWCEPIPDQATDQATLAQSDLDAIRDDVTALAVRRGARGGRPKGR